LRFQLTFLVAIKTHRHCADHLTRDGVKPVTYASVAVAAGHVLCQAVDNFVVRRAQQVFGELVGHIPVTQEALLVEVQSGIHHQSNVGGFHLFCGWGAAVAGDTAQSPVHRLEVDGINEKPLEFLLIGDGLPQYLCIGVAGGAFT
jgi:hypothetical protein